MFRGQKKEKNTSDGEEDTDENVIEDRKCFVPVVQDQNTLAYGDVNLGVVIVVRPDHSHDITSIRGWIRKRVFK